MSSETADVVVETFIAAPPERIWEAWTNPHELEKWFFSRTLSMDAKPNGSYRMLWNRPKTRITIMSAGGNIWNLIRRTSWYLSGAGSVQS
jgi:uncharacterized protein YndB with AHSA1/START domain